MEHGDIAQWAGLLVIFIGQIWAFRRNAVESKVVSEKALKAS